MLTLRDRWIAFPQRRFLHLIIYPSQPPNLRCLDALDRSLARKKLESPPDIHDRGDSLTGQATDIRTLSRLNDNEPICL